MTKGFSQKEYEEFVSWMDKMIFDAEAFACGDNLFGFRFYVSPEDALDLMEYGVMGTYKDYPVMVDLDLKPGDIQFTLSKEG